MSAPISTPAWTHGRSYTFFCFLALRTVTDLRQKRYICIQIPLRVSAHVFGVFHNKLPLLQQLRRPISRYPRASCSGSATSTLDYSHRHSGHIMSLISAKCCGLV
ncbi:hypothetical protein FJTKL_11773 [Diaporthe vaccinii]|uniref:Uncharacterized protein n=1 Tax=Diaporthe vaccinii TaxID=105482 RepID=A0ABR4EF86_9PEZI